MQSQNNIVSINADEALQKLYAIQGAKIPQELDIQSFMNTLDSIVNKDNFIAHLQKKNDSQNRLAYLNLVEPTLKRADIELTFLPNKKEYIKSFKDKENNLLYLLVTKNNDKTLITGIPNANERYVRSEINKADIIHSFVPQDRQTTEVVNGLSTQILPQNKK